MLSSNLIRTELEKLIGLPIWGAAFAADMLMLQFGAKYEMATRSGTRVEVGEYALHIQVRWRISMADEIVVGAVDHWCDEETSNSAEVVQLIEQVIASQPKVVSVCSVRAGAFSLELEDGACLEVFPSSGTAEDDEFWRLLSPALECRHFVVSSNGVR